MCNHPSHTMSYSGCEPKMLGHQNQECVWERDRERERESAAEGGKEEEGKKEMGGEGRGRRVRGRSGKRQKLCHLQSHPCSGAVLSHVRLFKTPWTEDSPGKNTGVGCHALLQRIFPTQGSNPGLQHCRWILYQLNYQGSPMTGII